MSLTIFESPFARLLLDARTLLLELAPGRLIATSRLDADGLRIDLPQKSLSPSKLETNSGSASSFTIRASFPLAGDFVIRLEPLPARDALCLRACLEWTGDPSLAPLLHWRWRLENRSEPFFLIPGVLYGTNNIRKSPGSQPKLAYRDLDARLPESPLWHVRADRSPAPFVSADFDGAFLALAVFESWQSQSGDWGYNSLGLSTHPHDGDSLAISLGALDAPARPIGHDWNGPPVREPVTTDRASADACLYCSPARDRFAYEPFHRFLYDRWRQSPRRIAGWRETLADIARPLGEEAVSPETGLHYTLIPGTPDGRWSRNTLIGFCGGLQAIQPMLAAARLLRDSALARTAISMIDKIAREALNPATGFLFDGLTVDRGWTGNYWLPGDPHSAYSNGQAAFFLTRAYLEEKKLGFRRDAWLSAAESIVRASCRVQLPDGRFPLLVSTADASVLDPEGFAGCWLAAACALYARATDDADALHAASRACEAYVEDLSTLELLGAPHDISKAPDEEGVLALVKLLRILHETTRDDRCLERALHALEYLFTWKFVYNTRHRAGPVDWSSAGGDITSTHNIHIHAMGNMVAGDILYFADRLGDDRLRARLRDTLLWGLQLHNRFDGELGFGRKGWLSEQYYHTAVKYQPGEADGGVWLAYLPWTAGAVLSSLTDGVPPDLLDDLAPPLSS
ncbi:MAG: hypothetical protein V2A58_06835 [Planctomycetota bacterium]